MCFFDFKNPIKKIQKMFKNFFFKKRKIDQKRKIFLDKVRNEERGRV